MKTTTVTTSPVGRLASGPVTLTPLKRFLEFVTLALVAGKCSAALTRQLTGDNQQSAWKTGSRRTGGRALVPAFIVEGLDDGLFAVFVPSVPTTLTGAVYILVAERVHPLSVSVTQAAKVVTRWGTGSKVLVDAMHDRPAPSLMK